MIGSSPAAPDGTMPTSTGQVNEDPLPRLDELARENEDLGRELLRCFEQLNLVFEITEHIANLRDPQCIQDALLCRFGTLLGPGAIFIDRDGEVIRVEAAGGPGPTLMVEPRTVRGVLARQIASVRKSLVAEVAALDEPATAALGGAHTLLVALRTVRDGEAAADVVVALRHGTEPEFDSGDLLAAEAVLGYGGHILSNVLMLRHLQQTALETVCALANAIDAKDNYTSGHSERVGWLARFMGMEMGVDGAQLQALEWGGLLHDVGKIGVPEAILNKPGKLTDEEFVEMKKHPVMSYEVLEPVASLGPILPGVLHHHENHDGSGYPQGLTGERIPLAARVLHVVDIFDALTSSRSYRKAFSVDRAFQILEEDAGRVTEPHVTRLFIDAFRRYMVEQRQDFEQRFAHVLPDAVAVDAKGD